MKTFSTPMMKQYVEVKEQYQDCLVFFRMGDFYELFLDDALTGAKVLDITLTKKNAGKDGKVPMAGVPYHAVDSYLAKLVKAGYKVAICEQLSEPDGKGIVERDVIRVVTPGTMLDEKSLSQRENNYIITLTYDNKNCGLAVADLSTGQFLVTEFATKNFHSQLVNEITRLQPTECILPANLYNNVDVLRLLRSQNNINIFCFHGWHNYAKNAGSILKKHFNIKSLSGFGVNEEGVAGQTAAALLGYLKETQKDKIQHITKLKSYTSSDFMHLDRSTIVNLELFKTLRDNDRQGSLINVIDNTTTAMGGRNLRDWLRKPLTDRDQIIARHEAVAELLQDRDQREALRDLFYEIADIERILSRLSIGVGNARDLISLKYSLQQALRLKSNLRCSSPLLTIMQNNIPSEIEKAIRLIEKNINDEPPVDLKVGKLIKAGIHQELDELRKLVGGGKDWVEEMERQEKARTNIASLKVGFNKVFGFYIEVSKSNLHLVPKEYVRKQTLVNAERFITQELKEKEEIILSAEEKICDLEYTLFINVLNQVLEFTPQIQKTAEIIAVIDCLAGFAHLAEKEQYCRPEMLAQGEIHIQQGRHPVVEKLMEELPFVPNDVLLNHGEQQLLVITGPNMAGKSVFIRQVALITLMAQIGSFVPAKAAKISIVDRIFVRSGASDIITSGLSTFMVEMVETAHILHHATSKSLIIMDEIGRGTSTYDGISIAWAVAEYLVTSKEKPKTLFATHYHELQTLEQHYPAKIKNFHMAVKDEAGEPIFLHTIMPGGASHSYGVAVAQLAGVPAEVTKNALEMLHKLENRDINFDIEQFTASRPKPIDESPDLISQELMDLDIVEMTPLEALNKLAELKSKVKISQIKAEIGQEVERGVN